MRLLARERGAGLAFTDEIIDLKLSHTTRRVVDIGGGLSRVDYVFDKEGNDEAPPVLFSTCVADRPIVLQLGTSSAQTALAAALKVQDDVDAVDINLGCCKHFSVQGGMGSELLRKPSVVQEIVRTLVANLHKPVTCKMRLLDTITTTVEFVQMLIDAGAAAVTIHARRVEDKPNSDPRLGELAQVRKLIKTDFPIVGNGGVWSRDDISRVQATGVNSVMIARGVLRNASLLGKQDFSFNDNCKRFLELCVQWRAADTLKNAKYTLLQMCRYQPGKQGASTTQTVVKCKSLQDLWCVVRDALAEKKNASAFAGHNPV
eukprot:TRINITY_DN223_c0_g1_i5.p1 TRINITY_DN223_c0_g1~~TRINITY_DN223_c0_g1_i5.p1  ORF type:complete len:364 (+),score=67.18 TRINITY_DN223_c0_g1_i5:143-1093(+)